MLHFMDILYEIVSNVAVNEKDAFMLMEETLVRSDGHYFTFVHICMVSEIEMLCFLFLWSLLMCVGE